MILRELTKGKFFLMKKKIKNIFHFTACGLNIIKIEFERVFLYFYLFFLIFCFHYLWVCSYWFRVFISLYSDWRRLLLVLHIFLVYISCVFRYFSIYFIFFLWRVSLYCVFNGIYIWVFHFAMKEKQKSMRLVVYLFLNYYLSWVHADFYWFLISFEKCWNYKLSKSLIKIFFCRKYLLE